MQDMVKLATNKSPSFSNISALAVSNFVLSHTFGQLRPTINDPVYSDDSIGVNTYSVVISKSGCVDATTEFCTPTGWKPISKYQPGDLVLSWGSDNSSEFVKPEKYVKNPAKTLNHFKSKTIDMMLSNEHNMALADPKTGKVYKQTTAEFKAKHLSNTKGHTSKLPFNFNFPKTTKSVDLTDDELRLFVAYVADGTMKPETRTKLNSLARVRVKKEYKKEQMRKLLQSVYGSVDERVTESEPEYSRFYFKLPMEWREKSFQKLWGVSQEQSTILAEEFHKWDGGIDKRNGSLLFRTTKKEEADFVQFIWRTAFDEVVSINSQFRGDKCPTHTEYLVVKSQYKSLGFTSKDPKTLITEVPTTDGFEYCFTMPNSNWVARRNGKIFLTGNSGKDSTYQAITKATKSAIEYIQQAQSAEAEDKARHLYCKSMKQTNPDFDESAVQLDDYRDQIANPEMAITNLSSTRGGLTSSMNRMAHSEFGTKSIYSSELGMSIQSNSTIMEVLELFSVLFDMGKSVAPEFKTADSKEEAVVGQYVNLLGISSPTPFYNQEGNVRKLFVPLLTTSLARRTTIVFSTAKEEFENEYIPKSPAERREINATSRRVVSELTQSIDKQILTASQSLMVDRSIMFDEEAAAIYDDYKSYTNTLSKLLLLQDGESVEGIEMAGRAFKMGRIAATWALAQDKRIIDKQTLVGAIYFADYTAEHLTRFAATLELKDYELFINDWEQGFFDNVLPIDKAITRGYLTTRQVNKQALESFLKPVNSRLAGTATVSYNEKDNSFVFIPVISNTSQGDYSYRAVRGISEDRPIHTTCVDRPLSSLGALLAVDSSVNPFVGDTTKFVTLVVSGSFLSMSMVNRYLTDVQHFISSSADPDDQHSFVLTLPLNTVIPKSAYKFVCLSIAESLCLRVLPEQHEADSVYHGSATSIQLTGGESAQLFDVSGILGEHASGSDTPKLATKSATKLTKAQVDKYIATDIMAHKQQIIDVLDASSTPLLVFASLVYDLKVHYVSNEQVLDIVDNINSQLLVSITESVKNEFIINPFKEL